MTPLRRFLVFQAFLLWQGGFLFYAAVVVPVGTDHLGSARDQGFITQRVTDWLNVVGVGWAVVVLWDLLATRDPHRWCRRVRWAGWGACVGLLGVLATLHPILDYYLDPAAGTLRDRGEFYPLHEAYLWASTGHWLLGLVLAWTTLRAWAAEDRSA